MTSEEKFDSLLIKMQEAVRRYGEKHMHEFDLLIYFYLIYQTHGNGD